MEVIFTFFPFVFIAFQSENSIDSEAKGPFEKCHFQISANSWIDKGGSNKTVARCRLQFPLLSLMETNTGQIERVIILRLRCLSWSSVYSIFIENGSRKSRGRCQTLSVSAVVVGLFKQATEISALFTFKTKMLVEHRLHLYLSCLCFPFALWYLGRKKLYNSSFGQLWGKLARPKLCSNKQPMNNGFSLTTGHRICECNWFIQLEIYSDPWFSLLFPPQWTFLHL